jgi:hypothetical protein
MRRNEWPLFLPPLHITLQRDVFCLPSSASVHQNRRMRTVRGDQATGSPTSLPPLGHDVHIPSQSCWSSSFELWTKEKKNYSNKVKRQGLASALASTTVQKKQICWPMGFFWIRIKATVLGRDGPCNPARRRAPVDAIRLLVLPNPPTLRFPRPTLL